MWGGLGDNLQLSTLPEKFAEKGYESYISDKNVYRNPEIYNLVWEINPYVKGISNKEINIGHHYHRYDTNKSIIYNQELSYGLLPTNETPKIYYNPNIIENFNDVVLVDISSISIGPKIPDNFDDYIKEKYPGKIILIPEFKNQIHKDKHYKLSNFKYDDVINVESIFHYTDLVHSCKQFICAFSGQSVLASAIDKKNTTCFVGHDLRNNDYIFPNIEYHIIK